MLATDPLSLLFMACFFFGLLFLIVAVLLGSIGGHGAGHTTSVHHIDVGGHAAHASHVHGGHGIHPPTTADHGGVHAFFTFINPTSIVLFLLGFGFFGYAFHNTTSLALPLSLSLAVVGGLIIATLLLMFINRVFRDSEGVSIQDVSDRTGLVGKVSLTIQENGIGEVLYVSPGGMRKSIPARSVDGRRLERDQEVVVVNYQRGIAEVDTWDHFVNQEEPGSLTAPTSSDGLEELRALLAEPDSTDTKYVMRKDSSKE